MRNPHESSEARELRHRQEAAASAQYAQQAHERQLKELKEQMEALKRETPDPSNWQLMDVLEFQPYTVIKLQYSIKLHNGVKILVYRASLVDLIKQRHLDPHFAGETSTGKKVQHYPIARFAPTDEGWQDAIAYAQIKQLQDSKSRMTK